MSRNVFATRQRTEVYTCLANSIDMELYKAIAYLREQVRVLVEHSSRLENCSRFINLGGPISDFSKETLRVYSAFVQRSHWPLTSTVGSATLRTRAWAKGETPGAPIGISKGKIDNCHRRKEEDMRTAFLTLLVIVMSFQFSPIAWSNERRTDPLPLKLDYWGWRNQNQNLHAGISLNSDEGADGFSYLWFYEWHLFDALNKSEHSKGSAEWEWTIAPDGRSAKIDSERIKLTAKASDDGADLTLRITNTSDHNWPPIAAIIPCLNPGKSDQMKVNTAFLDQGHDHTYFLGSDGLRLLKGREIHFNHDSRTAIMDWKKGRNNDHFVFSSKWPTSEVDAYGGLLLRESDDKTWVLGIAWESFISAQGHNPWHCMHLSIGVGPLAPGETKTIRGKMYLFEGTKEDCLERFNRGFRLNSKRVQSK